MHWFLPDPGVPQARDATLGVSDSTRHGIEAKR